MIRWHEMFLMALSIGLPTAVAVEMCRLRVRKEFPALFWFATFSAASCAALLAAVLWANQEIFCYFFWVNYVGGDILALAVMLGLFRGIFKPYDALSRLGTVMFRWTVAILLLVSLTSFAQNLHVDGARAMKSAMTVFDHSLQVLQCGVVLFLLLSSKYLGIGGHHRVFGISLGFGVAASINLLGLSVAPSLPVSWKSGLEIVLSCSVHVMFLIWLGYLYVPQPERRITDAPPESRRWEYALVGIQSPGPDSLFFSNIDRTVDRLLTKNNVVPQSKRKDDEQWFGD